MSASEKTAGECRSCIYFEPSGAISLGRCFRFARFVDHAVTEHTKDCDYWEPAQDGKAPASKAR